MIAIETPAGYNTISTIAAVALGGFAGAIWKQWSEALHEEFRVPRLLGVLLLLILTALLGVTVEILWLLQA
jgi:hypothetical protein